MVFGPLSPSVLAHLVALAISPVQAKVEKVDPINPDRPDLTDSTYITPLHYVVVELGDRQIQTPEATLHDLGDQAIVRIATSQTFEWRVNLPTYQTLVASGSSSRGWSDGGFGFKKQFSKNEHFSTGMEANLTFPIGSSATHQPLIQPNLAALASIYLGQDELDLNGIASLPADAHNRFTQFGVSASFAHVLTPDFGSYLEVASLLPGSRRGASQSWFDLGINHHFGDNCQADVLFGHGLNGEGRDLFFGGGLAFRFGHG